MTADTFIWSFRCLESGRRLPSRVISDNGRTFKSAAMLIGLILESPESRKYLSQLHIELMAVQLRKGTLVGDMFECMVKSAKRCLRKSVGKKLPVP